MKSISVGDSGCAVFESGGLKCWGKAEVNGKGHSHRKLSAEEAPFLFDSGVAQSASGADHSCAVFENGFASLLG